MKLPALIFDFGNVIAHFDYARAAARVGAPFGVGGAELLGRARAAGLTEVVARYEAGRIETEEFIALARATTGLAVAPDRFAAAWVEIFSINAPVARLAGALKRAGYRLVLGSNTNALHSEHFRRQFAAELSCFDRLVLSHEVGHIKPSPEFYHACVEAAGVPAADCLFIDDLDENVEGARAAGLGAVHYVGDDALIASLAASGVEVAGLDL